VTKSTPESVGPLKGMREGWTQMMDRLVEFVGRRM
jgi:hypothetical protein